jgi:predicted nuclease of predicted toxin-antitoxin system
MPPKSSRAFLVDENTSRTLASTLRAEGYSADHICEAGLRGHSDFDVFAYAQAHGQTIISGDLDFANIVQYSPPHFGIIILRLPNKTPTADLIQEVQNALNALAEQSFVDTLIIVELGRVRVRR